MFDYLYEWIQNVAFYLVLVTAVLQVIPNKDYKKYIRFFTGLVLILMMLTPILKVFGTEIRLEDGYEKIQYEKTEYEEKLEEFQTEQQTGVGEKETKEIEVEEIRID